MLRKKDELKVEGDSKVFMPNQGWQKSRFFLKKIKKSDFFYLNQIFWI